MTSAFPARVTCTWRRFISRSRAARNSFSCGRLSCSSSRAATSSLTSPFGCKRQGDEPLHDPLTFRIPLQTTGDDPGLLVLGKQSLDDAFQDPSGKLQGETLHRFLHLLPFQRQKPARLLDEPFSVLARPLQRGGPQPLGLVARPFQNAVGLRRCLLQDLVLLLRGFHQRGARLLGVRQPLRDLLPSQLQIGHERAQQEPVDDPRDDEKVHHLGSEENRVEAESPERFHGLSPGQRRNAKMSE